MNKRIVRLTPHMLPLIILFAGLSSLCATGQATASTPSPAGMFRNSLDHAGIYADSSTGIYAGVLWRKQLGSAVRSSPTIVGGVVLIGSSDGHFYALDANTGQERWKFSADGAVASSAAVAAGRVFFSSYKGTFYSLNSANGRLLWKVQFGPDASRAYEHETGEHPATYDGDFILSSAAVLNDTVVVGGGDGLVYAFNTKSGSPRWKFRTGGRVRSSPAINNGVVYVGSYDGSLYAIDFNSGKLVWRYDTKGRSLNSADFGYDRRSILSSPAVSGGVVYIGSRDSHLYAVDAAKGTLRWVFDYEKEGMTWAISSPAVSGQVVYTGTADGHFVHALRASDGQELWRFKMPSRVWSSPAVAGSELYVTNQSGSLYAVDLSSGKEGWLFQTRSSVQSSPAVDHGVVYFGSNDGGVYAIRADGAQPMHRAVYWDVETAKLSVGIDLEPDYNYFAVVRDFFQARGYEVLVSATVGDWLTKRISDHAPSVVVFPTDILPTAVTVPDPANGLFRQYLDAGGKAVWVGWPPMLLNLIVDNNTLTGATVQWDNASKLLGVSLKGALNSEMSENRVTPAGREWGLTEWWLGSWDLPISSDITALSLDERGFAGAWVKNYGGPPGTGFVYVGKHWDIEMLAHLAMIAEYRPPFR
jgi:eukaryotic-like serine/threonine-protein kinase